MTDVCSTELRTGADLVIGSDEERALVKALCDSFFKLVVAIDFVHYTSRPIYVITQLELKKLLNSINITLNHARHNIYGSFQLSALGS